MTGQRRPAFGVLLGIGLVIGSCTGARAADEEARSEVSTAIADLLGAGEVTVIGGRSLNRPFARSVYEPRAWEPLWIGGAAGAARAASIVDRLAAAGEEGLRPESYHVETLRARLGAEAPRELGELELLLTDAVARYALHLQDGALPARARGPEVSFARHPIDGVALVRQIASSPDVGASLSALAPSIRAYVALRSALASYRRIVAAGGWPPLPAGPKLLPGQVDRRVLVLRRRLVATGDLLPPPGTSTRYVPDVVAAVRRAQARHGLKPDGIVGKDTLEALNVAVARRIDQLVANLERLRWLPAETSGRQVEVNIPAFSIEGRDGTAVGFEGAVVVGTLDSRTPEFASAIARVIFNPRWTVPASIAKKELLPKEAATPGYFARQGLRALPDGRLRQAPGPQNPLGRVKFEFPNLFGVYLHDTSAQNLFGRTNRTLSHGCVRVANALTFASWLLRGAPRWTPERQADVVSSWETRTVTLAEQVPVLLVYRSAWVDREGQVQFRPDFYSRDDAVATALAHLGGIADARLTPPPVLPPTPDPVYLGPSAENPSMERRGGGGM